MIHMENNLRFIAIIPARWASSRFPGKPLADLAGMTVIERVCRRVSEAVSDVYVATDDTRIYDAVTQFGGKAIMTRTDHRSGTDRCLEAYEKLVAEGQATPDNTVIVNVQGDEPLIHPEQIRQLMACFDNPDADIATLVRPFAPGRPYAELANPNTPKVETDLRGRAMTFSRSIIPYLRGVAPEEWPARHRYLTHIGMYAYRGHILREIARLDPAPLETAESLEQMRWLQNGYTIMTAESDYATVGIDTPADLEAAIRMLENPTES